MKRKQWRHDTKINSRLFFFYNFSHFCDEFIPSLSDLLRNCEASLCVKFWSHFQLIWNLKHLKITCFFGNNESSLHDYQPHWEIIHDSQTELLLEPKKSRGLDNTLEAFDHINNEQPAYSSFSHKTLNQMICILLISII